MPLAISMMDPDVQVGDYIAFDGSNGGACDLRVIDVRKDGTLVARMILPRRREAVLRWAEDHILFPGSRIDIELVALRIGYAVMIGACLVAVMRIIWRETHS